VELAALALLLEPFEALLLVAELLALPFVPDALFELLLLLLLLELLFPANWPMVERIWSVVTNNTC